MIKNQGFLDIKSVKRSSDREKKAKRKESALRKVQNHFRINLVNEVHVALPEKMGEDETKAIADYMLGSLDFSRRKALCAGLGLGRDLNSNESEKALAKYTAKLSYGSGLTRFLLLATMVEHLDIPSFVKPKELSAKHPLMVAAKRYKVQVAKVMKDTEAELAPKPKTKPAKKAKQVHK